MFAHRVCSFWPIDRALSGAITPGQSGPGSNGNEGVLCIPRIFKAGASPSDGLMSYSWHSLVGVLLFCSDAVDIFYSPSQMDWTDLKWNHFKPKFMHGHYKKASRSVSICLHGRLCWIAFALQINIVGYIYIYMCVCVCIYIYIYITTVYSCHYLTWWVCGKPNTV